MTDCIYAFCASSLLFFFSSRRRHTRSLCDWSSDVCSSDLENRPLRVKADLSLTIENQNLDTGSLNQKQKQISSQRFKRQPLFSIAKSLHTALSAINEVVDAEMEGLLADLQTLIRPPRISAKKQGLVECANLV